MLQEKINSLKGELVQYATLVEGMIQKGIKGLMKKNANMLHEIIEHDEPIANQKEIELDEAVTTVIAQHQPAAKDLRILLMILKMNNDLERMGDHAVNIAESNLYLIERPSVKPLIDIPHMAEVTIKMLHDSIQAFINEDSSEPKAVCERDNIVDDLRDQIIRELITFMSADPSTIERALHLMRIAKNLERIADLATNICEDVMYIVEGRVIKHHQDEQLDNT